MLNRSRCGDIIRWKQYLCPKLNNNEWTEEEMHQIFFYYGQFGNKWKIISKKMNGRSENSIKNKFFSQAKIALRNIFKLSGIVHRRFVTKAVNELKPIVVVEFLKKSLVKRFLSDGKVALKINMFELLKRVSFQKYKNINKNNFSQYLFFIRYAVICLDRMNVLYSRSKFVLKKHRFFQQKDVFISEDYIYEEETGKVVNYFGIKEIEFSENQKDYIDYFFLGRKEDWKKSECYINLVERCVCLTNYQETIKSFYIEKVDMRVKFNMDVHYFRQRRNADGKRYICFKSNQS